MNEVVDLDQVRAEREARSALLAAEGAVAQSYRTLAAALAPLLPLPLTHACAAGDCDHCPGFQSGIICGHDCGHGFGAAS
jgi:hypothetical protein